jgi:hypothetical protein
MANRKKITVIYKKLWRRKAWGLSYDDDWTIEIDERAKGKKKLELLIHEASHLLHPEKTEEQIVKMSVILTKLLWNEGLRFIDADELEPLQDGSK